MQTLAHWDGGGPGPWVLFVPLIWGAVVLGAVTVLRRTAWRGRGCAWTGPGADRSADGSPIAVLGRRYASGEIDAAEYRRRLSVLEEPFARADKEGAL